MSSDDLSQSLLTLAAWMSQIAAGTIEMTPEGAEAFEAELDKAALLALAHEGRLEAAYGRRPMLAAIHDAMRDGKVVLLPTPAAIFTICGDLETEPPVAVPFTDGREA